MRRNSSGFTILELMIATTVFSVVLLIASAGIIAIGRNYYKSLTSTRLQENTRSVMDDISGSLQFSQTDTVSSHLFDGGVPATVKARCFGSDRYRYIINQKVQKVTDPTHPEEFHALYRDTRPSESTCDATGSWDDGTELLGDNMRLLQFDVSTTNPFHIKIRVAYGDNDLLSNYPDNAGPTTPPNPSPAFDQVGCKYAFAGNQFCAVAGLETTVTSRVK
jgi:prepilin-type N-terminal cleavage/methylation domain-containing protein